PVDRSLEMEGFVSTTGDDEREIHLGLAHAPQLALDLLGRVLEALKGHSVLSQVDPVLGLETLHQPVDDPSVHVFAAEERISGGRDDLEDAAGADLEDRDVEGASAEVVHGNRFFDVLSK